MIKAMALYAAAACLEIAGCYAFWMWLRLDRSAWFAAVGLILLIGFALVLTRIDSPFPGRAYAAYGGVYVTSSLLWALAIERHWPDRWDVMGSILCLCGAAVILVGPRN